MPNTSAHDHHHKDHATLEQIAIRAMRERGLEPHFPKAAIQQAEALTGPALEEGNGDIRDLRQLLWCSIDNDDSRDLDQLTVSESLPDGAIRIQVAIADVDALVAKGTPVDLHARTNTTSVYTGAKIFPMLPERLSTDLTSLNDGQDRLAVVTEYIVGRDGGLGKSDVYRALVHNHAKLAYNAVAAWIDSQAPAPEALAAIPGLDNQIRAQDAAAQKLRQRRHELGALDLETIEARPVFADGNIIDLNVEPRNRAKELIEEFMIAANGVAARFLADRGFPSLRRVVRSPDRWNRIVEVAAELGGSLPPEPNSAALEAFLAERRRADPIRFPDLSLVIVKLMGSGEYVVDLPGQEPPGHFGLAVRDYTHSTAPNRRFPDLITQRLVKSALAGASPAYSGEELGELASHATEQEDAANKVERLVRKSAAALLLESRIGNRFDAIVTGASEKGTWVRIFHPPVEGKLVHGEQGLRVGDKLRVKLVSTDVERGFVDFVRTGK